MTKMRAMRKRLRRWEEASSTFLTDPEYRDIGRCVVYLLAHTPNPYRLQTLSLLIGGDNGAYEVGWIALPVADFIDEECIGEGSTPLDAFADAVLKVEP